MLEPEPFVAVSVYVVVWVGLTLVAPVADVEVKEPGVIAMLAAPVTFQFRELLDPDEMVAGLAPKELMTGLLAVLTVTVAVEVV